LVEQDGNRCRDVSTKLGREKFLITGIDRLSTECADLPVGRP
jgi:hypothetical protein